MAVQRIRDPLHDLITFNETEIERALWKVVQTRPFQRLRRIKQLGFSDFVYPGASHTRFAHSTGVFHTARDLMQIVTRRNEHRNEPRERQALAAALLHDVGHGPFSHAFEAVGKRLNLKLAHHESMSDALIRRGEIAEILNRIDRDYANDVANIIQKDGVRSIEHAVVSSQFDADRLDYMRRDRMTTGTQHSAIDYSWLIANLEVGSVPDGVDDKLVGNIDTFVLGPKAIHAAEAYVLGLFQLYPTVYYHKATRGLERLFAELLVRVIELVKGDVVTKTGLSKTHPLIRFAKNPEDVDQVLNLDDAVVWGALPQISESSDPLLCEYAMRLVERRILKCFDIRVRVVDVLDPNGTGKDDVEERIDRCCAEICQKLLDWARPKSPKGPPRVLIDRAERTPYKPIGVSKGPLERIHIRLEGSGRLVDVRERSRVVAALKAYVICRAYADRDDVEARDYINRIIEEETSACLKRA